MKFTKKEKKANLEHFNKIMVWELEDIEGLEKYQLSPWQWRIFIGKNTIDIYPSSQKYFDLNKRYWGNYDDLDKLINNIKR